MTDLVQLGFKADSRGIVTAERDMNNLTAAGDRLDKQNKLTERSLGLVGAAIAALGISASTRELIQYADTWTNVNSQLRQVTSSEGELAKVRSQLLGVTRDTRMELTNTVNLYAEMTRGTSELNISSDRLVGVTKTLNNLFLAGGKPISESAGAIRQLNQGFTAGALRGDEFNSVAEGAPKVLDALQASLGMSRSELRAFAATGGITAQIMVDALEAYRDTAQKLADQTEKTFEQNLQNAQTNVTEFVGNSKALNDVVKTLGGGIEDLSENIDALVSAGGALVTVVGIGLTPTMYKYVASLAATTQAQLLAGTTATRTSNAFGVVTTTAASATVATNALGLATKFLMGPWGLLLTALGTAATAFYLTKESSDEVNKSLEEQAASLASLNKVYSAMTKSALEEERNKLLERSNEILFERLDLEKQIEEQRTKAFTRGGLDTAAFEELNRLKDALQDLKEESEEIDKPLGVIIKTLKELHPVLGQNTTNTAALEKANKQAAQSYADMVKNLELERIQLTMNNDEFEIYMVMQQASANQWTPEMTAQIIEQTRALQDQRKALETVDYQLNELMSNDELFGFGVDDKTLEDFNSLVDSIDNLGGSWSRTGSVIVDTFGSMADALDNYGAKMRDINKLQDKLNNERKKDGADLAKLDELQMKLNNERASAEIGNYAAITGAAQDMFSEKTAAYKAFSAINQALSIAEIALAYQKISASNQETANAIANEGAKQSSNALTAITSAFAAPFPANFAAGAAMIAIMSSLLGGSFGGGGGGYEKPELGGTGTVLGDSSAQSSSISNALNDFEDVQVDQLSELRGIRSALTGLSGGIERLAAQFSTDLNFGDSGLNLQNSNFLDTSLGGLLRKFDPVGVFADIFDKITGDFLGLGGIVDKIFGGFSSKKQKLVDSGITFMSQTLGSIFDGDTLNASLFQTIETTKKKFWGLSKSTSTSTNTSPIGNAINEQMADIFGFIGDSVVSAAESLGMDAKHIITTGLETLSLDEALEGFVIDIGNISFKDKTGEEIQKELEAIFSQQADLVAEYLVPSITEYQKVGEGAFETLQRVAYEQAVFNNAMDNIGIAFADLSNIMKIDVAQSVIGLIGSVEDFASLTNSFFENFYSESEQLSALEKSLNDVFESLGLSMVDSREGFRALVEGIDVTTEAGQEMLAALLEINPAMAEYLDALDDLANDKLNLQIQLLEKQGKSEEALALSRELELASMDESLHAIMLQIWALDDAARAERERAEAIAEAEALANQQKNLQVRLLEAQGKSEAALALQRELELASLDESLHALQKQIWAQEDLNKAQEALNAAREEERRLLQDNIAFAENELEKARRAEIDRINATVTAAQNAYDKQLEAIDAQRDAYNQLISEIEGRVSNAENALNNALSAELSKYDEMIAAANDSSQEQINAINSVSSARLSALNDELSIVASVAGSLGAASKQFTASQALAAARSGNFNPAANIATGGSFGSATEARIAAAREAFALNEIGKLADAQMSDLERTIAATEQGAQSQIDAINAANDKQVAELEAQKKAIEEQVKAVLGVDDSVLALDVAIAQYQKAQDELQAAIAENTLDKLQAQEDLALEAFNQAKESAQSQIDALNTQIDELLNIDNSVSSVEEAIKLLLAERKELADFEADVQNQQLEAQIAIIESVNSVRNAILDQAQNNFTKDLVTIVNDPNIPIVTPPIVIRPDPQSDSKLIEEIKSMKNEINNANRSMAKSQATTAKILQRIELDGLEVRQ